MILLIRILLFVMMIVVWDIKRIKQKKTANKKILKVKQYFVCTIRTVTIFFCAKYLQDENKTFKGPISSSLILVDEIKKSGLSLLLEVPRELFTQHFQTLLPKGRTFAQTSLNTFLRLFVTQALADIVITFSHPCGQ